MITGGGALQGGSGAELNLGGGTLGGTLLSITGRSGVLATVTCELTWLVDLESNLELVGDLWVVEAVEFGMVSEAEFLARLSGGVWMSGSADLGFGIEVAVRESFGLESGLLK